MFFFFLEPVLIYNWLLILAAVIPAIFLMIKVYQSDRLEPESPYLLWKMVTGGIWSAVVAGILEWIANGVLTSYVSQKDPIYNVIMYFGIVAYAEEGAKYFFLKRRSWFSREFNCQYDGVVYAVFVALGFALWENISYVMIYGFSTALVRAVTAVPGHACFGVFMGIFYGLARGCATWAKTSGPSSSAFWLSSCQPPCTVATTTWLPLIPLKGSGSSWPSSPSFSSSPSIW